MSSSVNDRLGRARSDLAFTDEQRRAIDRRDGSLLVSAGAGTGKTSVLVERFVQAVLADDEDVEAILAITFTEKAADQLTERVRRRFAALGEPELARETEGAWISTIHGFCARVLRTHALAAGLDPEFEVLDGLEAERMAIDSFDRTLAAFVGDGSDPERIRLLASYTPDKLAQMVRTVYGERRSRGEIAPSLPPVEEPVVAGEAAALRDAVAAALGELTGVEGKQVETGRAKLADCAALLQRLDGELAEVAALGELKLTGSAKALKGPACEAYEEARGAYAALAEAAQAYRDHVLLRLLVEDYGSRYAAAKRDRSALDFDDLELLARDLLRDDLGVRARYAEQFAHVMVDEYQDTNPLQNEILSLLERDNLFRVGDERQSIYGFRHADVDVFRGYRDAARVEGTEERITVNFRSDQPVLDAVDAAFAGLWGEEYEPLHAAREVEPTLLREPAVEVLVTDRDKKRWDERFSAEIEEGVARGAQPDRRSGEHSASEFPFGPTMRDVTPWRAAEARLLARRIDELIGEGRFAPGEIVMLLRATTSITVYERALEERGIRTYVMGGRGYWSQQQVTDLRNYLAALANPLDELALHSALASPLGGVSLDALVILAGAKGDVWSVIRGLAGESTSNGSPLSVAGTPQTGQPRLAEALPAADLAALRAFASRFAADRAAAPRIALEALIDRVVTGAEYDRAVLQMPAGDRRMANVRKLMRLARDYEAVEGRDLRGFIDFVAERDLVQDREGQAALDAEGLDAVRLMTVHRAKGLEFPCTVVADLGKLGREDDAQLRVTDDGRVGLRLASMSGQAVNTAELDRMKEEQKLEDEEEERRVMYVAATRAERHLILSGATDLEKLQEPAPLDEPMRWWWRVLGLQLGDTGAGVQAGTQWEGRPVDVRVEVLRPDGSDELLPLSDRIPSPPEEPPAGLEALAAPALAAVDVPRALPVSRISYSGLAGYARCSYRFYLDRVLRLAKPDDEYAKLGWQSDGQPNALSGALRGTVVHELLEALDFAAPAVPDAAAVGAMIESKGQPVRDADVEDVQGLIAGFVASPLCARIGAADAIQAELPFGFTLGTGGGRSLLVDGIVDVHAREERGTVLVVDYKSDRLEGAEPAERIEAAYGTQRLVYALAALRGGAERVEVVYCFLERPDEPVAMIFEAAVMDELAARLREIASGVVEGRFEPTADPHRGLCADCPGRPALCSWDESRTLAEPAAAAATS